MFLPFLFVVLQMANEKSDGLRWFVEDVCVRFYKHTRNADDVPEMHEDTPVSDVFDASSRSELFDWLSEEIGVDVPRFSFSLVPTLGSLYEFLLVVFKDKDDFSKYIKNGVDKKTLPAAAAPAKASPAAVPPQGAASAANSTPPSVVAKPAASLVDDMPPLEAFNPHDDSPPRSAAKTAPVAAAAKQEKKKEDYSAEFDRGRAVCAVLALGPSTVDVATKTVSKWSDEMLRGFLAAVEEKRK